MERELATAYALFEPYLPANTFLDIEVNDNRVGLRYIYRLQYTSPRSGKTLTMLCKGETLPFEEGDRLQFYVRQLVLEPKDLRWRMHKAYLYDRNAKRAAFLSGDRNMTIIDNKRRADYMTFEDAFKVKSD